MTQKFGTNSFITVDFLFGFPPFLWKHRLGLQSPYFKASQLPLSFCLPDLLENLTFMSDEGKDVGLIDRPLASFSLRLKH